MMTDFPPFKIHNNRSYHASFHGGTRSPSSITLCVIHCTESPNAKGTASYFAGGSAGGSTQLVVDDKECYRTLEDREIPYGAPGANLQGVHVEIVGYTAWSREEWNAHRARINHAAKHVARWCLKYDIPPKFRTYIGLRLGRKGVCSHRGVSRAWHRTDHTDPGAGFPYRWFMERVKFHYAALDKSLHTGA
jgi:hypothetical protein